MDGRECGPSRTACSSAPSTPAPGRLPGCTAASSWAGSRRPGRRVGEARLLSWRLPDGEPMDLGRFDRTAEGAADLTLTAGASPTPGAGSSSGGRRPARGPTGDRLFGRHDADIVGLNDWHRRAWHPSTRRGATACGPRPATASRWRASPEAGRRAGHGPPGSDPRWLLRRGRRCPRAALGRRPRSLARARSCSGAPAPRCCRARHSTPRATGSW